MANQKSQKIVSARVASDRTSLSTRQLARLEAAGQFVARVSLGPSRFGYVSDEVDAWIATRIAEREDKAAA